MIAIGILGVLAALLIPALMNSQPDQSKVMFKKAYSSIEQNVSTMINDDTNYPGGTTVVGFDCGTFECGFHNTTATTNGGDNKFCYFLSQAMNVIGTASCSANPGVFTTTDGIVWHIYAAGGFPLSATDYSTKVVVDVNGAKSPNCTADTTGGSYGMNYSAGCTAPDQFLVGVRYDGKLQVGATDGIASNILLNPTNNKRN